MTLQPWKIVHHLPIYLQKKHKTYASGDDFVETKGAIWCMMMTKNTTFHTCVYK